MVRVWLGPADLARVRASAGLHPAGTVMLASQALRDPAVAVSMPELARRIEAAAPLLRPLHHLVPSQGFLPDFLTPKEGSESLAAGLAAIRSAGSHRIRSEVTAAYARLPATAMRRRFADADPEVLDDLMTAVEHYFEKVLAPSWAALQQADQHHVEDISTTFLRSGVDGVLRGLPHGLRWQPPLLEVDTWTAGPPGSDRDIEIGGHGVVLVASPFAGPRPRLLIQPGGPALIVYQAAATPVLAAQPPADERVDRLLGRTRAAVLRCVTGPGRHTTSTVAGEVGISASSSSEHLTVLRDAGLVSSHRTGGTVTHRATPLGRELIDGPRQRPR
jgi:DNA-binding transcriptional ArsR family regulator